MGKKQFVWNGFQVTLPAGVIDRGRGFFFLRSGRGRAIPERQKPLVSFHFDL